VSRRLLGRRHVPESSEESVWISFSDLMTALLTVFMLAAVALVFSLTQEQDALADAKADAERAQARSEKFDSMLTTLGTSESERGDMVKEVRDALVAKGIDVDADPGNSVLRVPVELLGFESGSYEIKPEHQANALAIGKVISKVLLEHNRYKDLDTVFIEGHTDNVPIDGTFGGNWGLSANRAISLWKLWEDKLPNDLGKLKGHGGERLFSVSGYGATRPVIARQDSEKDRAANRRIDIRFTEHRLSEAEIANVRAATGVDES